MILFAISVSALFPGDSLETEFPVSYPEDTLGIELFDANENFVAVIEDSFPILDHNSNPSLNCMESMEAEGLTCYYTWTITELPTGLYSLVFNIESADPERASIGFEIPFIAEEMPEQQHFSGFEISEMHFVGTKAVNYFGVEEELNLTEVYLSNEDGVPLVTLDAFDVLEHESIENLTCTQELGELGETIYNCEYSWTVPELSSGIYNLNFLSYIHPESSEQSTLITPILITNPLSSGENGAVTPITSSLIDDDLRTGSDEAPLVLIQFSDPLCSHCRRFHNETLPQLTENYVNTNKLQIVLRDFPMYSPSYNELSYKFAEAVECAHEQGNGLNAYDLIFEKLNEKDLDEEGNYVYGYIDVTEEEMRSWFSESEHFQAGTLNACLNARTFAEEVENDAIDALSLGLRGVPSFVLGLRDENGEIVYGAQDYEFFEEKFDHLLYGTYSRFSDDEQEQGFAYGITPLYFTVSTPHNNETHLSIELYDEAEEPVHSIESDLNLHNYLNIENLDCHGSVFEDDGNFESGQNCYYYWDTSTVEDGDYSLHMQVFLPSNEEGSEDEKTITVYNLFPEISYSFTPEPTQQYEYDFMTSTISNQDTNVLISCNDNGSDCEQLQITHYVFDYETETDSSTVTDYNGTEAILSFEANNGYHMLYIEGTGASDNPLIPYTLFVYFDATNPVISLPNSHSTQTNPTIDFNVTEFYTGINFSEEGIDIPQECTEVDFNEDTGFQVLDCNIDYIEGFNLLVDGNTISNEELRVRIHFLNDMTEIYQFFYTLDYNVEPNYVIPVSLEVNDMAGNPLQADWNYFVDNTHPVNEIFSINPGTSYTKNSNLLLTVSASDNFLEQEELQWAFSCDNESFTSFKSFAETTHFHLNENPDANCNALDGNKTVFAKVQDLAGNESNTLTNSIMLDTTNPSKVTGLSTSISDNNVQLNWTAGTDNFSLERYKLYRSNNSDFSITDSDTTVLSFTLTDTNYLDSSLSDGTYYYRITALDSAGNESQQSDASTAIIGETQEDNVTNDTGNTGGSSPVGGSPGGGPSGGTRQTSPDNEEEPQQDYSQEIQEYVSQARELQEELNDSINSLNALNVPVPVLLSESIEDAVNKIEEINALTDSNGLQALQNAENLLTDLMNVRNSINLSINETSLVSAEDNETVQALLTANDLTGNELVSGISMQRTLTLVSLEDNERTKQYARITLVIQNNSDKEKEFQLIEFIPKEFTQSANTITSTNEFTVLVEDPVIVFNETLNAEETKKIVYGLKNLIKTRADKLKENNTLQFHSLALPSTIAALKAPETIPQTPTGLATATNTEPTGFLGLTQNNIAGILTAIGLILIAIASYAKYGKKKKPKNKSKK